MDRDWGAPDALAFVRATDFAPSTLAFDAAFAQGGLVSKVGFVTMGESAGGEDIPTIGVGMLGYGFMGKAHSNAYKTLAYMTWPPPLMPQLVSIAGRNEEAVAGAARRYGFADHVTDWKKLVTDPRIGVFDNSGPEQLPRRADDRRRRGGQARDLREAARAHRRRGVRDLAAGRRDGREGDVRLQLPLRPGRAAGAARSSPPATSARSSTSAGATCRSGSSTPTSRWSGAWTRTSPARARSATSART